VGQKSEQRVDPRLGAERFAQLVSLADGTNKRQITPIRIIRV